MTDQAFAQDPVNGPDLPPPPQGALPVWLMVYSKPGETTFASIINHPDATARNAYIWIFIAGMVSGLISSLTQFVLGVASVREAVGGFDRLPGVTGVLGATGLFSAICGAPIAGIAAVIGFAIGVALIHWAARFFGTREGSFDQLAYALGAVSAPFSLMTGLLIPFNAIRFAAFCILPLFLIAGVYVLYLQLAAVKAVYRTGWFEAAGAFFLPTILIIFLCACAVLGLFRILGPSINEVFQQVQQNL